MREGILLLIIVLLAVGCIDDNSPEEARAEKWLAIGHTKNCGDPGFGRLPAKYEQINYEKYKLLLLTGDMSCESSLNMKQLNYLDSIFQLHQPTTLWALGNHDYQLPASISLITRRPSFYSYHHRGITFIVVDNQLEDGQFAGEQQILIDEVLDTISESSHLILLHHKLFWMYNHPLLHDKIDSVSNAGLCEKYYCLNPNNFYEGLYSKLVKVQQSGVQIICLGGDIGVKVNAFEYHTAEDIIFLATGVENTQSNNRALQFDYLPAGKKLSWKFVPLEELHLKISI